MKKTVRITIPISMVIILISLLIFGYTKGHPLVVKMLGGNEVDIALKQDRTFQEKSETMTDDTSTKNYLPPLPKYSYLSEDEINMLDNPSLSSEDSVFFKTFPDLLQARDTLRKSE